MRVMTVEEFEDFKKNLEQEEQENGVVKFTRYFEFLKTEDFVINKEDDEEAESRKIIGSLSSIGNEDAYGDIMVKGCFDDTIKDINKDGVPMLWSHNKSEFVGEWVKTYIKNKLLMGEGDLYHKDIQRAKEAVFLYQKDLVKGISIGFTSKDYKIVDEYNEGRWVGWHYEFYTVDIYEASLTAWPANEKAQITEIKNTKDFVEETIKRVKSQINNSYNFSLDRPEEIVDFLANHGLSETQAKSLINMDKMHERSAISRLASFAK